MSQQTIAVVGASRDRRKFGNKCVRAYLERGYLVYPINLTATEIEGLPVFAALSDVPARLDRISFYLPPEKTRMILPELASHSGTEIWFNPGSVDAEGLEEAARLRLEFRSGCSIVDIGLSPSQFP